MSTDSLQEIYCSPSSNFLKWTTFACRTFRYRCLISSTLCSCKSWLYLLFRRHSLKSFPIFGVNRTWWTLFFFRDNCMDGYKYIHHCNANHCMVDDSCANAACFFLDQICNNLFHPRSMDSWSSIPWISNENPQKTPRFWPEPPVSCRTSLTWDVYVVIFMVKNYRKCRTICRTIRWQFDVLMITTLCTTVFLQ